MAWYNFLNPVKIFESLGNGVSGVVETFSGSQKDRDSQDSNSFISGMAQYSKEFIQGKRTWFDSAMDGFNRTPRPAIVSMVIYYFSLSYIDPIEFQKINLCLDTVPEKMWFVLSGIMAFYFHSRIQHHRDRKMALSNKEFQKVQDRMKKLDNMKLDKDKIDEADEDEYCE